MMSHAKEAAGAAPDTPQAEGKTPVAAPPLKLYRVQFRPQRRIRGALSKIKNLCQDELVMVQTDHGLEPARVAWTGVDPAAAGLPPVKADFTIIRRASRDEREKYANLLQREAEAFDFCRRRIEKLGLIMKLIEVERFFNGGKIIFYFTAENRVDFRALVKDLVQEFRTRVEMRQIGVRHETQMIGGLGCCGRELCCSSFMNKFVPVSIKMAKEQDLPLNPSKISGACNRLLCCLTHEYDTYKSLRKGMPKPGKTVIYGERPYKVMQTNTLKGEVVLVNPEDRNETIAVPRDEWKHLKPMAGRQPHQGGDGRHKGGGKAKSRKSKRQARGRKK